MNKYTICNFADDEIFRKQCRALEKYVPNLKPERFWDCLDGTLIQYYQHPKGKVEVRSDADTDVVYVDSEFDLLPYFRKETAGDREINKFQDQDMVRIKKTGVTGKIINIYHYVDGEIRYDVEGHRKVMRKGECESLYSAEELEKID